MNILFTVCGRAGSKGAAGKNFRMFLGKPLYAYTLRAFALYKAQHAGDGNDYDIVLSTDGDGFSSMLENYNGILVRKRPAELAQDTSPKMPAIKDAAYFAMQELGKRFDLVVDLDITSPIRTSEDIAHAIEKTLADECCDVVTSVTYARRSPYFNMLVKDGSYYHRVFENDHTARQQVPITYDQNASIYVYRPSFLFSDAQLPANGNVDIIIMRDTGVLDIDSESDFELMEIIAKYLCKKYPQYELLFDF